jgi:hypothetical protein
MYIYGHWSSSPNAADEVNAPGPPEEKPLLGGEGLRKLSTTAGYHALDLLQAPFGFVFWTIEQLKGRLQDRIDKERSEQ